MGSHRHDETDALANARRVAQILVLFSAIWSLG
jgi:hypothetical protein